MVKKVKSKPKTHIRGRVEKTGLPKTRLVVAYHDLPERMELPPRLLTKATEQHYCPNPYKLHNKQKVLMHRAGWAWSGARQAQRWRCPRCGYCTTFVND